MVILLIIYHNFFCVSVLTDVYCLYVLGDITSVSISVQDYPPGSYNLTIIATDIFNQTVDEGVSFVLAGMPSCSYIKILLRYKILTNFTILEPPTKVIFMKF